MAGLNCGQRLDPGLASGCGAGIDVFVAVSDSAAEESRQFATLAAIGIVAGETGGAGLAGLAALHEAAGPECGVDLHGRHALVLCTEGATDPENYERIAH